MLKHLGLGFIGLGWLPELPSPLIASGIKTVESSAQITHSPMASESVPSLWSIALKKTAHMLDDTAKRPTLLTRIERQPPTEIPRGITLPTVLGQRIEKAMDRDDLRGVLVLDISDVAGAIKTVHVLERCSGHWQMMKTFLRLAAVHRLTPANATPPLRLSAESLPATTAFDQMPLAMALYATIGQQLTHRGTSLALQQVDDGHFWIGDLPFRVVPLGRLPGGHPYTKGYTKTDPPIYLRYNFGCTRDLFPSFSTFLIAMLLRMWYRARGVGYRMVLGAGIGRDDPRYRRLITERITEDLGIAVDWRYDGGDLNAATQVSDHRRVIVSGFRLNETIAAHLRVVRGVIELWTTERPAASRSHPLAVRYPVSMPLWGAVLRRFGLEHDVINGGRVAGGPSIGSTLSG
ncbi:unnamed protein product [Vitrella brassicaformis CCMP3155]|uniref:Uncharacterized protein n=1 Tax=Vitrella brassicaformis (strain CCMP3155) TaxID=1169540 RepID=A0A0G4EZU2_VITBC|nr:unnamed protein product [Vitrella brassicaformis CCMP3155]|eukprot:CEM04349.1 unnamed protein product [Vitrella brassicaformis CCMP3155]